MRRAIVSPGDRRETRLRLSPLSSEKNSVPGMQLSLNVSREDPVRNKLLLVVFLRPVM